jgi:membrane fusion protein, multidrug efflux system
VITSGLKPGERIVINGMQRARPGTKVTPKLAEMTADTSVQADSSAQGRP